MTKPINKPVGSNSVRSDRVGDRRDNPRVDAASQGLRPNEPTPPRNPVELSVPDSGASETFIGGAGI
jgi:hypothetical protein